MALGGCSREDPDAPPQVHYGRDECQYCGMIIGDERCAAAIRATLDGSMRDYVFDDIGDMFVFERKNAAALSISRRFVHDYETKQWIDAVTAFFIRSEDLHTPMGSGIIAVGDPARAEALQAKCNGKLFTFEQLKK
jgi:copper chaperone NosL